MDARTQISRVLLTDCDGTLTNVAGEHLVFSDHYNAVMSTPDLQRELKQNLNSIASLKHFLARTNAKLAELQAKLDTILEEQQQEHPLEKSGFYDIPDAIDTGANEPSIPPESEQAEYVEITQLKENIATLSDQKKQLEGLIKNNHPSIYHLVGSKQLNAEEVKTRSHEILQKMQEQHHDAFNLADGAKEFLMALLNDNSTAIHIISKNHEEYIRAMLMFNGFSEEQVDRMHIHDIRKCAGNKDIATLNILDGYDKTCLVTACDDNGNDCLKIKNAAKSREMNVVAIHSEPGKFNFEKVLEKFNRAPGEVKVKASKMGLHKRIQRDDGKQADLSSPPSPRKK